METKLVKLGDIISLNYGKSLTKKNRIPGDVPVYGSSGITDYHDKPLVDAPSLIIGRKGSIGSVFLSEVPFYPIDTTYFAKESDLNGLDLHFAYYFLKFLPLSEMNTDSAVPGLNRNNFYSLDVVIPDIKSQKIIAFLLDQISYKIKINQQINKNLLKLSVLGFNKWLDSTQSNQYTSLDKIASFKNGIAMQKFSPTDKIHVLPVIKIRELNQGYIDSNSDSVTSVIDDDVKVHNGDLVFSWSGTLSAKIWTDGDAALNQHLFKVTSNRWPKWFYYLWVLHHLNTFRGIAADKKTTMGHIKRKDLTNAKVLIPNAKEFKNLDTILNPIIEQMVNGGIESKNLIDIRNILLPKLLSGSMDLSSIEETINND